jgi:NAD(P)-dependent dehydrogenase (short-subunit alcohol dehydrogenase family)
VTEIRGASALVTGAGRGIGRAISLALAREGAKVAAVARSRGELDALVAEIRGAGGQALAVPGDLRDPAFPAQAVAAAVSAHGRLSILVNNAGVGGFSSFAETTDAQWDQILGTNLTGVFRLTRAALPHLTQGGGDVYMVSSLAGQNPIAGLSAYCASKAALDHLSTCLMLEVRDKGVRVSVLAPGSVNTGFADRDTSGDSSWMLQPEDIADAVLDLVRSRGGAHLSRVEMRPARPQKR